MHNQRTQGNKFLIRMSIQVIKQFIFQEDVWELIKEFLITNRSKLLLRTRVLSINTLSDIFKRHFRKRVVNIRSSSFPLKLRKNVIIKEIVKRCEESPEKYAEITIELQPKVKDYGWLSEFHVGQEVLVAINLKGKSYNRKGVVRKIGKTVQVDLYNYELVRSLYADRMLWLNTFEKKVSISNRDVLRTKTDCFGKRKLEYLYDSWYDEFDLGKKCR